MQEIAADTAFQVDLEISEDRHNLGTATLYEHAVRNNEGLLANAGPLVVSTGQYTGRSPRDKFVVEDASTKDTVWWGPVNQSLSEESFNRLRGRVLDYLKDKPLYVQDVFVGADLDIWVTDRVAGGVYRLEADEDLQALMRERSL